MSACSAIVGQRLDRAGDDVLPVHLAVEELVEQRPDPLRADRLRRPGRAARRESRARRDRSSRSCASATQSAKCGDHVEQDLVAIGDEQRPAVHASSLRRASTSSRRRDAERFGAGEQVRLVRLEEAQHRGEQAAARRAARAAPPASSPVSASSRCARASSPSVQPSARQRQRLGIGRICVVAPHRLEVAPVGQKILVVEDNELNLKLFCDLLRAHGYEAEPVRDGREAVERARAFAPDLIVMDIQMPHMSAASS